MIDVKKLAQTVGDLEEDEALEMVKAAVSGSPDKETINGIIAAFQEGLDIVGQRFETEEYFVADLVLSGELMDAGMKLIEPYMSADDTESKGTIVVGSLKGDLHDIGKNIFKTLAQAAGFVVYDIGIDQPAEAFIAKAKEVDADFIGMSGLLTLAIESARATVTAVKGAGCRAKTFCGGIPFTEKCCERIGADFAGGSASNSVQMCLKLIIRKGVGK